MFYLQAKRWSLKEMEHTWWMDTLLLIWRLYWPEITPLKSVSTGTPREAIWPKEQLNPSHTDTAQQKSELEIRAEATLGQSVRNWFFLLSHQPVLHLVFLVVPESRTSEQRDSCCSVKVILPTRQRGLKSQTATDSPSNRSAAGAVTLDTDLAHCRQHFKLLPNITWVMKKLFFPFLVLLNLANEQKFVHKPPLKPLCLGTVADVQPASPLSQTPKVLPRKDQSCLHGHVFVSSKTQHSSLL